MTNKTAYKTALSYEYLLTFNNVELIEIEELCIATQDTDSLHRIQLVKEWRSDVNRTDKSNVVGFPIHPKL